MDWKVVLLTVGSVIASGYRDDILDLEHTRPNQFTNVQWLDKPKKINRKRRSSESTPRHRRDTTDTCSDVTIQDLETKMKLATNKKIFKGDSNPSIALAWTGDDGGTILAITTYESFVSFPSVMYRSTDGGRTFENITSKIDGEYIRRKSGVVTATADSTRVILIVNNHPLGFSDTSTLYITKDRGATWKRQNVPFDINGQLMKFHPKNPDMILTTDVNDGKLWITRDFCENWKQVHESGKAHSYKWDPTDDKGNVFYYTHDPTGMGRRQNFALTLYRSIDAGETVEKLTEHVWSFGTEDKFLYVSVRYQPEGQTDPSRIMHVSTNRGKSFDAVQLPAVTSEQFYSILDANEDMIFMHVDDTGDTGKGTIFTSDETGIIFSVSLEKNLYPNGDDVTDFVRIESLNGVYVTSQLKEDQSIESLITYDKGATWDVFDKPMNCEGDSPCGCNKTTDVYCHLQIHCAFSIAKGVKVPEGLYSSPNAPGLIFGHGNVGDALSTDDPDLFVSSDGGYEWNKSLTGPHKTRIGDSGAVVWAVVHEEEIDTIKFSFDEGQCWHSYQFSPTKITITGLVAEPGEKATDVAIWGWDDDEDAWVVYTFDFKSIMAKPCDETNDYVTWFAHENRENKEGEKGCQLGQKLYMKKLKRKSVCYQGKAYQVEKNPKSCTCTKYDFLCDYGYLRNDATGDCEEDKNFPSRDKDICIDDHDEEIISHGYKKIPGDKCDESGAQNKELFERTVKTIKKKCPKQKEIEDDYGMKGSDSWIDYHDIWDIFDQSPEKLSKAGQELETGNLPSGHGALIALLVIGIICSVGAAGFFYRKSKTQSAVVQYQTFTDDDVPRLDVGTTTQYRDNDAESEDDDMLA